MGGSGTAIARQATMIRGQETSTKEHLSFMEKKIRKWLSL